MPDCLLITAEVEIETMYVPDLFGSASASEIQEIIETYSFATLITVRDGELQISHLPLVLRGTGRARHRDLSRSARLRVA